MSAADLAIAIHNRQFGKKFPAARNAMELATETCAIIALMGAMGIVSDHGVQDVIFKAIMSGFEMGHLTSSCAYCFKEPTEAEMRAAAVDPAFQASLTRAKGKVELAVARWKLAHALLRIVGASRCCWKGWRDPAKGFTKIVMSCLNCGEHQFSWPDDDHADAIEGFWSAFILRHGRC